MDGHLDRKGNGGDVASVTDQALPSLCHVKQRFRLVRHDRIIRKRYGHWRLFLMIHQHYGIFVRVHLGMLMVFQDNKW